MTPITRRSLIGLALVPLVPSPQNAEPPESQLLRDLLWEGRTLKGMTKFDALLRGASKGRLDELCDEINKLWDMTLSMTWDEKNVFWAMVRQTN